MEELRQCGEHIPSTDADKMFFLVEVRTWGAPCDTRAQNLAAPCGGHTLPGGPAPLQVASVPPCLGPAGALSSLQCHLGEEGWVGDVLPAPMPPCAPARLLNHSTVE